MTRTCLVAGLVLGLGAPCLFGADDKGDRGRLQGTWKLVKLDREGKAQAVTEESDEFFRLTFAGGHVTMQVRKIKEEANYVLGTAGGRKTISITPTTGDDKGKKILGIYKLDGDRLTLAVAEPGARERPTEFKGVKDRVTVYSLERARSKP